MIEVSIITVSTFIILLTAMSTLTGFAVEGAKKILDEQNQTYSTNLLACIVGVIVGILGSGAYYILTEIPFTAQNIVCMVLIGVMAALGSMVGYDKIIQLVEQFEK
jgi:uncharacterized protein YacL